MPRQSPRKRTTVVTKTEVKTEVPEPSLSSSSVSKTRTTTRTTSKRKIEAVVKEEDEEDRDEEEEQEVKKPKTKTTSEKKTKQQKQEQVTDKPPSAPAPKKRKTAGSAKQKPEDMPPLAARTAVASLPKAMYIGAHVSAAGGVQNAVHNAVHIGANAFALFLKSQRKWDNPPLAPEAITSFHACSKQHGGFDGAKHCVPHGSYLVNLAAADAAKAEQAYGAFLDDLRRCESLGIGLYNFHPGNTNGEPRAAAIGRIAAQLNRAHAATQGSAVVALLENMAGQGNVVGTTFEDLRDIIALVTDKARVGVCIDTCHAFAAGYDLRTPETFGQTMKQFGEIVGTKYLRALHLNDSKAPLSSHRDLHANIGTGFLGLRAFHNVMNHDAFAGLPMVLETPIDRKGADGKSVEDKQVWADEIKLLESLVGMDADGAEFAALADRLQGQGEGERGRVQDQVDRKAEKDAKKGAPKVKRGAGKKKKGKAETESDEESS